MPEKQPCRRWSVYIIEASDTSLYTGIAVDVQKRFDAHLRGAGARYFAGRTPQAIVYLEPDHSRSSALKREYEIKQMSRQSKLALIAAGLKSALPKNDT